MAKNDKKRAFLSAYARILARTPQKEAEKLAKEFQTIRDGWEVLEILRKYIPKISFKNYGEAEIVEKWYGL